MISLDSSLCRQRLEELAARITANPDSPFGMSGVALFAADALGTVVSVYRGTDILGTPLHMDSQMCLASVGKMAVALLVLRLVDRGLLSLDQPLSEASGLRYGTVGRATIAALLSHRAGVPPVFTHEELPYSGALTPHSLRDRCRALDINNAERQVCYSDIAYALLVDIIEAHEGLALDACLQQLNSALGTRLSIGKKPGASYAHIAGLPSAHVDTDIEPLNSHYWHGLALPWAGISGSPDDGLRLVRAFAHGGGVLSESLQQQAISDPDDGLLSGGIPANNGQMGLDAIPATNWSPCPWGLGVELRGDKNPHWTPREAHPSSFGHVGISGTLAWHDPTMGLSWAMAGTRSSFSGWLIRHGPLLGRAVLSSSITRR